MWRLYLALVLFAALLGTGVALYALSRRETPGGGPLALLLLSAALWSTADALSLANAGGPATAFWAKLGLSITAVVALSWLLTTIEYTGHDRDVTGSHLLALLVEPVVFTALVWTNGSHHLVWSDVTLVSVGEYTAVDPSQGVAFWGHITYSYVLIAIGAFLLVRVLFRANDLYRAQSTALLAAITVPLIANAASLFGATPRGIDPTPVAFVVTGVIVTVAIFRQQLLTVAAGTREIGRDEIVAELDDGVFILDEHDAVIDCNPAAAEISATPTRRAIGRPIDALVPALADALPEDADSIRRTLRLQTGGSISTYDCRTTPLERPFDADPGLIVSLRDVTAQTRRKQQLEVLNRLLRHNVRNEMNVVRGHAELLGESADTPQEREHVRHIIDTVDAVTGRSDKVGRLARAFESDRSSPIDLENVLTDAIESVRADWPDATIELQGTVGSRVDATTSLGVAFEELLSNAVEHNDVGEPTVTVTTDRSASDDTVQIRVSDDGPGIDDHEREVIERGRETPLEHGSGIGLWIVAWIVRNTGGTIDFVGDDVGTTVVVGLPIVEN